MKVQNMIGPGGHEVPNQYHLTDDNGTEYFQSYTSIIAKRNPSGAVTLDAEKWDYSKTTGKYRNAFLGETKTETLQKIASGVYKLADLNGGKA